MAKAEKKKKAMKKSARVTAKTRTVAKAAKTAKKKPAAKKQAVRKIDPINRTHYRSVTPMLVAKDMQRAVDFYKTAFGFQARAVMDSPQGIIHAELTLRESVIMLSPESRQQNNLTAGSIGDTPVTLYVLVDNVDQTFSTAVAAGAAVVMQPMDMFWGDRCGMVKDLDGNKWMIATHKAEPTPQEMEEAMRQMQQPPASASAGA
jgi:PhnB protein